jgi:hypothetical protein
MYSTAFLFRIAKVTSVAAIGFMAIDLFASSGGTVTLTWPNTAEIMIATVPVFSKPYLLHHQNQGVLIEPLRLFSKF